MWMFYYIVFTKYKSEWFLFVPSIHIIKMHAMYLIIITLTLTYHIFNTIAVTVLTKINTGKEKLAQNN